MNRENLLRVTLFVSIMILNPLWAEQRGVQLPAQTKQQQGITAQITQTLYKRGLEKEAAERISSAFVGEDAILSRMLVTLLHEYPQISQEEVLSYLATQALHRRSLSLDSYDGLIAMMGSIQKRPPDAKELHALQRAAQINRLHKA